MFSSPLQGRHADPLERNGERTNAPRGAKTARYPVGGAGRGMFGELQRYGRCPSVSDRPGLTRSGSRIVDTTLKYLGMTELSSLHRCSLRQKLENRSGLWWEKIGDAPLRDLIPSSATSYSEQSPELLPSRHRLPVLDVLNKAAIPLSPVV